MSRGKIKILAAAATAAVSGSMVLWRKLMPLEAPTCEFCGSQDIHVLRDGRGMELGQACLSCDARYAWDQQARAYQRLDADAWDERVAQAAEGR